MGKGKTEFRLMYENLTLQVIGYERACVFCAWFILKKCVPRSTDTVIETDRTVLVDILLRRYETVENYEFCSLLLPFKNGYDISGDVTDFEMEDYLFNLLAVLNYEVNIEQCAEIFWEWGLIALSPFKPTKYDIDYIILADRVLDYLRRHGRLEEFENLLKKRKQIMKYRATGRL